MSLLTRLSKFILVPILTEWLPGLTDIARLDCSLCKADRVYLKILSEQDGLQVRFSSKLSVSMDLIPIAANYFKNQWYCCNFYSYVIDSHCPAIVAALKSRWLTDSIVLGTDLCDQEVVAIVFSCPQLRKVVVNCKCLHALRTDISCRNLLVCDITCSDQPSQFVIDILRLNPFLIELKAENVDLSVCQAIVVHGRNISRLGIESTYQGIYMLLLYLSYRPIWFLKSAFCVEKHLPLLKLHTHLPRINFENNQLVNSDVTCDIIRICSEISEINIKNCMMISEQILPCICTYLPRLTSLNIGGLINVNGAAFTTLITTCTQLKELCLYANGIPPTDLTIIGTLRYLEVLQLSACRLTDEVLLVILPACRSVTHLGLSNNDNLTSLSLSHLGKCLRRPLHLDLLLSIDCASVVSLAQVCSELTYLNLSARNISESALVFLVSSMPNLITLYLRKCMYATDAVIDAIGLNCRHLENLTILGSEYVTVEAVMEMYSRLKRLKNNYVWLGNDESLFRVVPKNTVVPFEWM